MNTHATASPTSWFSFEKPLRHAGPAFVPSEAEPFAYRWYEKDRLVLGRRMEDQLRFAVCYWHSFVGSGTDPFGEPTFGRPWHAAGGEPMQQALQKAEVAFELFSLLGVPFFTFHDRDIAPEGRTLAESNDNVRRVADVFERRMAETGVRLLWGTANLFSHPRYMAGAATNPDPDVFAYAAAQVCNALEVTHRLGGANYVLWGGREGYDTLLNTDLRRELAQLGRFLAMVVEHKHRIGFKGQILIEPKPAEPTKHQYDFDVGNVHGFLRAHGLEREVKVNIEQNHALLAGHTFEHEIALAQALGIFGSLDMNRGDELLGWDTDQFPLDVQQVALALYEVLQGGGIGAGGLNFDAKLRRQSIDPDDLVWAHATAMDTCARGLLVAERMVADGALQRHVESRYAGWAGERGRAILEGRVGLADLAREVQRDALDPRPRSGRQERLEHLVAGYL
jgi:xylose isomerase